jgi:hypothetical protein
LIHKAKTEEPKTEMQQLQTGLVNTKKWYMRKADLWAELDDEYHSAGKIFSKESVKDACSRQCAIARERDCLHF